MIETIIISLVTLVITFLMITKFSNRYRGLERLSEIVEEFTADSENVNQLKTITQSLVQIGYGADAMLQILNDEEAIDSLLTALASKIRKSFVGAMMGTASGDSRKKEKAERMVNEAIVTAAQKMNPMVGVILKATGIDQELQEDPELMGYILQVLSEKNLGSMLQGQILPQSGSLNTESGNKVTGGF